MSSPSDAETDPSGLVSGQSDRESPSDRKSLTRMRLLEAMIEVGARLGYADSSVERVIEGREIARSTFYEHFRDRGECFLAALEMLNKRLLGEVERAVNGAEDMRAAQAAVVAMIAFAEREPAAGRLLFLESLAGGERSLALREVLRGQIVTAVEEARRRAQGKGIAPDLPAAALIGGIFRLLSMRLRHGEAGLDGLGGDLVAWIDSYSVACDSARWRRPRTLDHIQPLAAESLPALDTPPALPGGRHRLSAAGVARSQRLRILAAASKCSYEKGYAETSVADITSAAQVSRNAFYVQFRSKAHAATEANERGFQGAMSASAGAFFATSGWPERVWAGGLALLSFLALHPAEAYMGFVEVHVVGTPAVQHTYDRVGAFALFLEEGYHWRPQAGELPKTCSDALGAMMFELAFAELRKRRSAEGLLEILPLLAYLILAPFMGSKEASEFVEGKASPRGGRRAESA